MIRFERPEDFRVDEVPLYAPSGEGGHTFLRVEKRERNTDEVARDLARAAGVHPRDVGFAGRKDRMAIATQWFSVPRLSPRAALALELPGARVLEARPHRHKLRTGQLRANCFELRVRDLSPEQLAGAEARLARLMSRGLPNRFGAQRFGRDGENATRARRLLAGEWRPRDRRRGRFLFSALQAEVFNAVLDERGDAYDRVEPGDVAVVHASGGLFVVEDLAREAPRAAAFEISPTGPIFGRRVLRPRGEVAAAEQRAAEALGIDADNLEPPPGIELRGARRPLRVRPEQARIEPDGNAARVWVRLPPGSYATVFAEALFGSGPGPVG